MPKSSDMRILVCRASIWGCLAAGLAADDFDENLGSIGAALASIAGRSVSNGLGVFDDIFAWMRQNRIA